MEEQNENQESVESPETKTEPTVSAEQAANTEQIETSKEARNMAMLCHLLGLLYIFGPLIVWLLEKDKHRFVNEQGKEAVNWQITVLMCAAVLMLSMVGSVLLPVLAIINIIFVVMGAMKASEGKPYRYPVAIRLLK